NNTVYSIESYALVINDLAYQFPDATTEHALLRLQEEVALLTAALRNHTILDTEVQYEYLSTLILSTLFRAEQLNRLHKNANERLRNQLAEGDEHNVDLLIKLTILVLLFGGVLVTPLLASIRGMVQSLQNSEQRQRTLKETAELERSRMRALLSAMSTGVLFEDKQGRIAFINPAFSQLWAIDANKSLVGQDISDLLKQSLHCFVYPEHCSQHVLQVPDRHEVSERFEIDFHDGRTLTQLSFPVLDADESLLGRLWMYEDITHERKTAQQLLYLAEHDPVTGLYNRHRFQKQLAFMINASQRNSNKFALLYFDLDEFKFINDTFGHGVGDSVLLRTANEISALVRGIEMFARVGGDEFALIAALGQADDISALPVRIITKIASIPFRFRSTNLRLTASVGVAIYPEHGNTTKDLTAHADAAMYQAKSLGKNTWSIYNPERTDSAKMVHRMNWSRRIGQALEQDLFELHFQGVHHIDIRKLSHFEVLVRMRDPAGSENLIMPGAFIPFAEKNAQIVEIDRWVLDRSIALLALYPELPTLAVNISGRSFDEPSLPDYINGKLNHYGINPARLIIELTETETVSDLHDAQRFIAAISQAGCRICLDDFGSGFSTFTYLKYLNVEILKIDGEFIQDLSNNHENQIIVKAMVNIAQGLEKLLVAEFVEDAETLGLLQSFGVQFAQGYYLDRPVSQGDMLQQQSIT
ncbi:MAG TPA: EAL domain-containing protein, partial [Nitrosomonas sp.]|nr:hypothetical protein [Nitrosomonas sp.]HNP26408.1 EAL domain-containing protein [Nitrosomonas sp.]